MFNDTIFRNVEYGLIGTAWEHETRERKMDLVRQACKEAYADEFISRLPEVSEPVSYSISFYSIWIVYFL